MDGKLKKELKRAFDSPEPAGKQQFIEKLNSMEGKKAEYESTKHKRIKHENTKYEGSKSESINYEDVDELLIRELENRTRKRFNTFARVGLAATLLLALAAAGFVISASVIDKKQDSTDMRSDYNAVTDRSKPGQKDRTDEKEENHPDGNIFTFDTKEYRHAYAKYCELKEKTASKGSGLTYDELVDILGKPDESCERIKAYKDYKDISAFSWKFEGGYFIDARNGFYQGSDKDKSEYEPEGDFRYNFGCVIDGIRYSGDFGAVGQDEAGMKQLADVIQRINKRKGFEDAEYFINPEELTDTPDYYPFNSVPPYIVPMQRFSLYGRGNGPYTFGSSATVEYSMIIASVKESDLKISFDSDTRKVGVYDPDDNSDEYRYVYMIKIGNSSDLSWINNRSDIGIEAEYVERMGNCIDMDSTVEDVRKRLGEPDRIEDEDGTQIYCYILGKCTLRVILNDFGITTAIRVEGLANDIVNAGINNSDYVFAKEIQMHHVLESYDYKMGMSDIVKEFGPPDYYREYNNRENTIDLDGKKLVNKSVMCWLYAGNELSMFYVDDIWDDSDENMLQGIYIDHPTDVSKRYQDKEMTIRVEEE